MFASSVEWLSSGWVVAGLWVVLFLEGSFSIGMAWLIIFSFQKDAERAGRLLLTIDNPAAPHGRRRSLGLSVAVVPTVAIIAFAVWIVFSSRNLLYAIPVAGLFVILAARLVTVRVGEWKYCPEYVQIREHGLLYPASQPLHFLAWGQVRWYAVRQYRPTGDPDFRLIVQGPGHCQNLPVRESQVAQIESCFKEHLTNREWGSDSGTARNQPEEAALVESPQ
ncbi:MAG TPA: hypothetical protein VML55_26055 [Planctomycetaceae bacterium]|nr:hypothetical protein [Planctomycetaceae bacterium]